MPDDPFIVGRRHDEIATAEELASPRCFWCGCPPERRASPRGTFPGRHTEHCAWRLAKEHMARSGWERT